MKTFPLFLLVFLSLPVCSKAQESADSLYALTEEQLLELYNAGHLTDAELDDLLFAPWLSHVSFTATPATPFPNSGGNSELRFKSSIDRELTNSERFRHRIATGIRAGDRMAASVELRREFSGRERFTHRSLSYTVPVGFIRELTVGNFQHQWGLGSNTGMRKKLTTSDSAVSTQSLLYPDTRMYNGLFTRLDLDSLQIAGLVSASRDENHLVTLMSLSLLTNSKPAAWGIHFGDYKIASLENHARHQRLVGSFFGQLQSPTMAVSTEVAIQESSAATAHALLARVQTKQNLFKVSLDTWLYADNWLDLAGEGMVVSFDRHVTLDELDYTYLNNRAGQRGGRLTASTNFHADLVVETDMSYGQYSRDTSKLKLRASIAKRISPKHSIAFSVWRVSGTSSALSGLETVGSTLEVENIFTTANVTIQPSIGMTTGSSPRGHASIVASFIGSKWVRLFVECSAHRISSDYVGSTLFCFGTSTMLQDALFLEMKFVTRQGPESYLPQTRFGLQLARQV